MNQITLTKIIVSANQIIYNYHVSPALEKFFNPKNPLTITYTVDNLPFAVDMVPQGILAIPFVCNVLPIIWLTDSILTLPELDKDFYECIPNVKKGYEAMFPESAFTGEVRPQKIAECNRRGNGCGAFFSGGLDATHTLVSHVEEQPHLISIWGSDIEYSNEAGWKAAHDGIAETAQMFDLPDVVIRSTFREFDREDMLHREFAAQLKDSWWHGVKHGLGLLGHAAPYAFLKGLSSVYIASSHCPLDGQIRCASHPSIDNHVRFCGCQIVHDGYQFSRQNKAQNIVDYCTKTQKFINLHVCWESQTGKNCCHCEKCYRTMVSLIAEGADPYDYGFSDTAEALKNMQAHLLYYSPLQDHVAKYYWVHIQNCIKHNLLLLKKSPYWADIKWLLSVNFHDIRHAKLPLSLYLQNNGYLLREKLAQYKFYQALHRLKEKL